MNTRSIRFRLVAWYAGLLIVVFVILGGAMYGGIRIYLERSLGEQQIRRAVQIADTLLANIVQTGQPHVVNEINSWFAPETNDRFIRITDETAGPLYVSNNPRDGSFDATRVPPLTQRPDKTGWRKQKSGGGSDLLIASVPYHTAQGKWYVVEVGASLGPVQDVLRRLVVYLGICLAAMVVIGIGGGYFLVRRALAPVDGISSSAEHITLHNLKERLPVAHTGDELERLSMSLNHMIARLEDAFQQNRRFTADASHELRTPLTIMRGELESIVEGTCSTGDVPATAASILEEVQRMARIVEGLFAISRLDAGEAQAEWRQFDLAGLAAGTAEQMCLLAEDKGISISTDADQPVEIKGDRARMKQVVVNLLDNAIKYTPSGGSVRLCVRAAGDKALLEVADSGIGIPTEAQPHIFERFFRVDTARSRDMGGAGLGLSIVKSICTAHGGRVNFQSNEGKGSSFTVELPLARATEKPLELKSELK
jgi:heavy metal sensor kinase